MGRKVLLDFCFLSSLRMFVKNDTDNAPVYFLLQSIRKLISFIFV